MTIRVARGNVPEATITAIKDFTVQWDFASQEEQYLGERTMRKDDIFNGVSGSLTFDVEDQAALQLLDFIKQRAQRRVPVAGANAQRINLTARLTLPNGQTPRILIRDLKFDAAPLNVGGRDSYVNVALSYKADDVRVLVA